MRTVTRIFLWVGLVSLAAMFIFNFTPEDFVNAPLLGKINVFLIPLLLLFGATYQYTVRFDKTDSTITILNGLVFLHKKTVYSFDDLKGIYKRKIGTSSFDFRKERYIFGLYIGEKYILIEKGMSADHFQKFFLSLQYFFPKPINELEDR